MPQGAEEDPHCIDKIEPKQRPRALVVDDEIAVCELLSLYLGWKGLDVTPAHTSLEAMALATQTRFDVFLLDWDLDGVDGLDVLNFLKSQYPQIPVIIFADATANEEQLKKALAGRVDAILRKMGSFDLLCREVFRWIRGGEA